MLKSGESLFKANSLHNPISKITRAKWTGIVSQAAEWLLYKHKALSSNLSPSKTNKQKDLIRKARDRC
jgi:hypothetical protein